MTGHQIPPPLDPLIGAEAIGAYIGLRPAAIWHLARTGGLPVIRVGRKLAVRRARLAEWIAAQEAQAEKAGRLVSTNATAS